jgi:rhomboid family GlyGly-CTERM serine protease
MNANVNQGAGPEARKPGAHRLAPYVVPGLIAALAAVAELMGDTGRLQLRFDREGIAGGEVWRLVTAHLVHIGPSHLAMNLLALAILTVVLPALRTWRQWLLVSLASALFIDCGLYFFHPSVAWYVGLSGVLHGIWSAGVLLALQERRFEATPLAILLLLKLGYEGLFGGIPLSGEVAAGPVVAQAHAWGAAAGIACTLGPIAVRRIRRWL